MSESSRPPIATPPQTPGSGAPDPEVVALAERLFEAARDGDADTLRAYVGAGVPVDLTDAKGDTLLMLAAYHEHPDAVDVLLAAGADPGRVNDRGQTPLVAAVFRRSTRVVRALLDAGANPDHGSPSARQTAAFFEVEEVRSLVDPAPSDAVGGHPRGPAPGEPA